MFPCPITPHCSRTLCVPVSLSCRPHRLCSPDLPVTSWPCLPFDDTHPPCLAQWAHWLSFSRLAVCSTFLVKVIPVGITWTKKPLTAKGLTHLRCAVYGYTVNSRVSVCGTSRMCEPPCACMQLYSISSCMLTRGIRVLSRCQCGFWYQLNPTLWDERHWVLGSPSCVLVFPLFKCSIFILSSVFFLSSIIVWCQERHVDIFVVLFYKRA